jgi:hypothetical protein
VNPGQFKQKIDEEIDENSIKTEVQSPLSSAISHSSVSNNTLINPYSDPKTLMNLSQDEPNQEQNADFVEKNDNNTIIFGKLGINVKNPDEALTLFGNLKMTGNIYQPSDARVKENIREVLFIFISEIQFN